MPRDIYQKHRATQRHTVIQNSSVHTQEHKIKTSVCRLGYVSITLQNNTGSLRKKIQRN
jgi:hypothetical protein